MGKKHGSNVKQILPDTTNNTEVQCMMLPDLRVKRLMLILKQHCLWPTGQRILTQCCIASEVLGERKPNPASLHALNPNRSIQALLSSKSNLHAQKCQLQQSINAAGHQIIFYPPVYSVLNYIEYFYGKAKVFMRPYCSYTFPSLVQTVPTTFVPFSNVLISKYYYRTHRIIDTY